MTASSQQLASLGKRVLQLDPFMEMLGERKVQEPVFVVHGDGFETAGLHRPESDNDMIAAAAARVNEEGSELETRPTPSVAQS
jgi:hypothetical protein